jgi:hypothetical protein
MTADTFRSGFALKAFDRIPTMGMSRLIPALNFIKYAFVFTGYLVIFIISFMTVGFLEIRQANMEDFNALIAVLEQRDRYKDHHVDADLEELRAKIDQYRVEIVDSFSCPDGASNANTKTCTEVTEAARQHYIELSRAKDAEIFKLANLPFYYDQYKDGITQKTPQIIPALRLLDSGPWWLKLWARSPFELIEMFLLVFMGMLGGAISVMRCLFDPSLKTPTIAEFFYRPAAGAAISLGVYVLFRAAQIFLGVQSQGSAATVSTSVFLLAGLGLASGFSAKEALGQIDFAATRLLRTAGRGANIDTADSARGSAAGPGADHNSGPTITAGSPR